MMFFQPVRVCYIALNLLPRYQASSFDARVDYFALLGVNKTASQAEIKNAYHARARMSHPDLHIGQEETFKVLTSAYQVLSDPAMRRQYERFLESQGEDKRSLDQNKSEEAEPFELFIKNMIKWGIPSGLINFPKKEDGLKKTEKGQKRVSIGVLVLGSSMMISLMTAYLMWGKKTKTQIDQKQNHKESQA